MIIDLIIFPPNLYYLYSYLSSKDPEGMTALLLAASFGHLKIVKFLLEQKEVNPMAVNKLFSLSFSLFLSFLLGLTFSFLFLYLVLE